MIDFTLLNTAAPLLARASLTTLTIAFGATLLGLCGGTVIALAEQSTMRLVRMIAALYVTVVRGTPMIVQIVFLYYGLNLPFSPIIVAIIAIGLNSSAYVSQTIKTGINSVAKGEIEAAIVMGIRRRDIMRFIILPQAFRAIFPSLGNEFVTLIKDSSLAYIIGVHELFKESRNLMNVTYDVMTVYVAVTLFYLVLTYSVTLALREYEKSWEREC
jgi:His/Glu/Gln/Arg/opine family amino acid ABC transporter permease subunit